MEIAGHLSLSRSMSRGGISRILSSATSPRRSAKWLLRVRLLNRRTTNWPRTSRRNLDELRLAFHGSLERGRQVACRARLPHRISGICPFRHNAPAAFYLTNCPGAAIFSSSVSDDGLEDFRAFRDLGKFRERMNQRSRSASKLRMALLRLSSCACMAAKRRCWRQTNNAQNTDRITAATGAIKVARGSIEPLITRYSYLLVPHDKAWMRRDVITICQH